MKRKANPKRDIIVGAIYRQGLRCERTAELMGMAYPTFSKKIAAPDKFTLGEFKRLNALAHFTEEERKALI